MKEEIFQESNANADRQLFVATTTVQAQEAAQEALSAVPDAVYPNNPGRQSFLSSTVSKIVMVLSVVSVLGAWNNSWKEIKKFSQAKNKNLEKTVDLSVNLLTTAGMTALSIIGWLAIGGVAGAAVMGAPYLLLGVLGLGAGYGLYLVGKHAHSAYRAHKAGDKALRNEHLKALPKQIAATALNALGFIINFIISFDIGSKLSAAYKLFQHGWNHWDLKEVGEAVALTMKAGSGYKGVKDLVYALGCVATLGLVTHFAHASLKKNVETLQALAHPIETLRKVPGLLKEKFTNLGKLIKKSRYTIIPLVPVIVAVEAIGLVATGISRMVSLVVEPFRRLGNGIKKLFAKKEKPAEAVIVAEETKVDAPDTPEAKTLTIAKQLFAHASKKEKREKEIMTVKGLILEELNHLNAQKPTKKIQAKLQFVEAMQDKVYDFASLRNSDESVSEVETRAKEISPLLYQSFWKTEGRTEKIARMMQDLENKYSLEEKREEETTEIYSRRDSFSY